MIAIICTTYDVGVDRYTPNKKADNKAKSTTIPSKLKAVIYPNLSHQNYALNFYVINIKK